MILYHNGLKSSGNGLLTGSSLKCWGCDQTEGELPIGEKLIHYPIGTKSYYLCPACEDEKRNSVIKTLKYE